MEVLLNGPWQWLNRWPLVLVFLSLGCSWRSQDGVRHYPVLGFGIVTTSCPVGAHEVGDGLAARAERLEMSGLLITSGPARAGILLGHETQQTVEIEPTADVVI